MKVRELSRDQLTELKRNYLMDMKAQEGAGVSYGELFEIDSIISDDQVFNEYEGFDFTEEDF